MKVKFKNYALFLALFMMISLVACRDKATINQDIAGKVITDYLNGNPEYRTVQFKFGEIKVNSNQDQIDFELYRNLETKGIVEIERIKAKKKFLSKDSSFVYLVKLTALASPLVLKQSGDKATVKAVEYVLNDEKPVDFSLVNSSTAKVTVSLKKVNTDFAPFGKDPNENTEVITKTYKLKLNQEEGWKIQN